MATGLVDDGQGLLPHVVDGRPHLLEELEVRPEELGRLAQAAEPVQVRRAFLGALGRYLKVERHGGHRPLDRLPQGAGVGLGHRSGVVGQDLHLSEAGLLGAFAPEATDTICHFLTSVEHLCELRVPGLHRGPRRHGEEPGEIAGQ